MSAYQYKPLRYFPVTFLVTFTFFFAGAYLSWQDDGSGGYMFLLLAGLVTPFVVALAMIFGSKDAKLKRDFINRLVNPKLIEPKILPFFFLLMPLVVLVSIALSLPFGGSTEQLQLAEGFSFSTGFVPVLLLLLLAATFEELGWRGYAFDSLESRYTYFTASIIFSVLWSLWHLPLSFVRDSYQYEIFQENIWHGLNFYISIIPMGVIISWICLKNRKSVLAAILFHFIINMSQEALAITQQTKAIETVVLMVVTVVIIIIDRKMFFSRKHLADTVRLATPERVMDLQVAGR
ncbi:MAG: CPBP family intramembrane metalloprotease [Chloroflexi bacterium]|nr:MAG: CPBP family intramembrane metalloprotease [Chloroflexota bacterium]